MFYRLFIAMTVVGSVQAGGDTSLHKAAANGDFRQVVKLYKSGESLLKRDQKDRTPLHFAAANNHVPVIALIICIGLHTEQLEDIMCACDENGHDSCYYAQDNFHEEALAVLNRAMLYLHELCLCKKMGYKSTKKASYSKIIEFKGFRHLFLKSLSLLSGIFM